MIGASAAQLWLRLGCSSAPGAQVVLLCPAVADARVMTCRRSVRLCQDQGKQFIFFVAFGSRLSAAEPTLWVVTLYLMEKIPHSPVPNTSLCFDERFWSWNIPRLGGGRRGIGAWRWQCWMCLQRHCLSASLSNSCLADYFCFDIQISFKEWADNFFPKEKRFHSGLWILMWVKLFSF